jgi:glycerophosphoryl diester phosphodiesterase
MPERARVLSHRGRSGGGEQENTLAAYAAAVARGVEGIELDVRLTADGALAISHDAIAGGIPVAASTLAELVAEAPRLCTFVEALEVIPATCLLDVEVKVHGVEGAVLRELAAKRERSGFVVTSFHDEIVARVKALDPAVRTGLVLGEGRPKDGLRARLSELFPAGRLRSCGADVVIPNWKLLHFGFLRRAARHGYPVWVWTVNDPGLTKRLLRSPEVGAIITDRPLEAMALRVGEVHQRQNAS